MKLLFFLTFLSSLFSDHCFLERSWTTFLSKSHNGEIVELARSTRSDDGEISEDDPRLFNLENLLNDYSSLERFIEQQLHLKLTDLNIREFNRNKTHPERTLIYFIYKLPKVLTVVIKGFHEKSLLAKELSSLEKLYSLNLNLSTTVAPVAVGKIKKNNRWLYLVAESAAPGKTITKLTQELVSPRCENRQEAFQLLVRALQKHGEALSELHLKSFEEGYAKIPSSDEFSRFMLPCRDCVRKTLEDHHINFDLDKMIQFYKDLEKRIVFNYPSRLYSHGDLNWCNIFYDPSTDKIIYIDTITAHRFIDSQNRPSADFYQALRDYQTAFGRMELFRSQLLADEKEAIEREYIAHYTPQMATAENRKILQLFWKAIALQGRIDYDIKYLDENPEYKKKNIKRLDKNVRHLKQLRKEFYELP